MSTRKIFIETGILPSYAKVKGKKEKKIMSYISQMDVNTYIFFNDHTLNNIKMKIKNMVKKCKKKTLLQHV